MWTRGENDGLGKTKRQKGGGERGKREGYIYSYLPFCPLRQERLLPSSGSFSFQNIHKSLSVSSPDPDTIKPEVIRSSKFNTPQTCVLCWHSPSSSCLLWRLPPRLTSVQTSVFSAKLSQLPETPLDNAPTPPFACRSPVGTTVPVEADTGELGGSRQETLVYR
jgi:hypothetical protein